MGFQYWLGADFYMSLYNVIFTVLPPLVIGIFDQDVDREMSRLYPGQLGAPSNREALRRHIVSTAWLVQRPLLRMLSKEQQSALSCHSGLPRMIYLQS